MTPAARVAAAIAILDEVLAGEPAEKALTGWARRSRFAGSKDRAAVRDHVFDALRKYQTYHGFAGGGSIAFSGRALMIGLLREHGIDPADYFTAEGHAPPPLSAEEAATTPDGKRYPDMPDWVFDRLCNDLGDETAWAQAQLLGTRAPASLRVNTQKVDRASLQTLLTSAGFDCHPNPLATTALTLNGHSRGLTSVSAFTDGLFDMQDAASQAVVQALTYSEGARVLDYCAGGGGKTLALAGRGVGQITAHDANPARLRDLPERARRAGADVIVQHKLTDADAGKFDLVLLDVPCSGSGSWRRAPDAKWRFTPADLAALIDMQREILTQTQKFVTRNGSLAYVTCSLLRAENEAQKDWFLTRFPTWSVKSEKRWLVSNEGDGFYLVEFSRDESP